MTASVNQFIMTVNTCVNNLDLTRKNAMRRECRVLPCAEVVQLVAGVSLLLLGVDAFAAGLKFSESIKTVTKCWNFEMTKIRSSLFNERFDGIQPENVQGQQWKRQYH